MDKQITHKDTTLIINNNHINGVIFDEEIFVAGSMTWKDEFRASAINPITGELGVEFQYNVSDLEIKPLDDGFGPIGYVVRA